MRQHSAAAALLPLLIALKSGCGSPDDSGVDGAANPFDATITFDAARDLDALTATVLTLNDDPESCMNPVAPLDGEEEHLLAVRLTPPSYPFQVNRVRYRLVGADWASMCAPGLAHRVDVWVGSTAVPAAEPSLSETVEVPADPGQTTSRWVELALASPIILESGQDLFIGVALSGGTDGSRICVNMCMDDGEDDRNYWSNAKAPPYSWAEMASFGFDNDSCIEAIGEPT